MTTAHRPTWKAAVGQSSGGGWSAGGATSTAQSALDVAAHTKLKLRRGPQIVDRRAALRESLLKLEEAEARAPPAILGRRHLDPEMEEEGRRKLLKQTAEVDEEKVHAKYNDKDDDGGGGDDDGWSDLDQPDESDLDESDSEADDRDDDSDEDEEAALQAELAKIRAEREAEKSKAEAEAAAQEEAKMEEAALIGNPLLAAEGGVSGMMKRRWNDDVVFRNQAKGEPEAKKRFINDTVRNDFHKRFLNKFVR